MMISRAQLHQVIQAYFEKTGQTRQKTAGTPVGGVQRGDQVQLSARARQVEQLSETISDIPEVRRELVDTLKAAVREGRYEVDPEAVAEKILQRLLVDVAQEEDR